MQIYNLTRGQEIATAAVLATTFSRRLRGWIGKKAAHAGEALLIYPCRGVHTFWMSFPIDVLFVSRLGEIAYIEEALPPGRVSPVIKAACMVLEMPAGTVQQTGTQVGDCLEIRGWKIPG